MSVNLSARDFTQPEIFAEGASVVIPPQPISGVAYRDPNVSGPVLKQGQAFDTIVDSRVLNQLLYLLSSFSREGELFGFSRWSPLTNYVVGSKVTAMNGDDYRALKPSGPKTAFGARNPIDEPGHWQLYKDYITGGSQSEGGLIPPGFIGLLPHRPTSLPFGWYSADGTRYPIGSNQDVALQALPEGIRVDFGITTTSAGTNTPNMFYNGKGLFFRPVDGETRRPGTIEEDAMREVDVSIDDGGGSSVVGTFYSGFYQGYPPVSGAFSFTGGNQYKRISSSSGDDTWARQIRMDMSNLSINVSTDGQFADENRPMNIGMTPAIHLGV